MLSCVCTALLYLQAKPIQQLLNISCQENILHLKSLPSASWSSHKEMIYEQ